MERKKRIYVLHKHYARVLHFDLRLEMRKVLKSWAVPKGAPLRIGEKRLAIQTENHPLSYAKFQGTIPEGYYGAGKVLIWDCGVYEMLKQRPDLLVFRLIGKRLTGSYALVHWKNRQWLWIKIRTVR